VQPAQAADPQAQQLAWEKEAVELIAEIDEVGRDVQYHAERIESYIQANIGVSHWTHYHHLEAIKELVNDRMRPALKRLDELQLLMPEWKQASIERMVAAAAELSKDATSAFVSKAPMTAIVPSLNPEYRTLARGLAEHSATLVKTADAAHSYAAAHLKATEAGLPVRK